MTIFTSARPLRWGQLDLPLHGIDHDWYGAPVNPPANFALAMDAEHLWFVGSHRQPPQIHPDARPGKFTAELWRYDVAELFLADPVTGRYLEFNLAPNGGWWNCELVAPRVRASEIDSPMPDVMTYADVAPDGSWLAAMAIPLAQLRASIDFGARTCGNVTFILGTPDQRFITAADLGPGEPDYHRPSQFPEITIMPIADVLPIAAMPPSVLGPDPDRC